MKARSTRREAMKATLWGLFGSATSRTAAAAPNGQPSAVSRPQETSPDWYRRLLVGIEWGPTGANDKDHVYMARADGTEIVRAMVRARAEYAVVFMKDMNFAYYNSKVARKCPNLGDRDLLRECLDEAKKHGMPVVAYCQIQYDTSTWDAHLEWRMKDPGGKDFGGRLCYTSGYLEYIKQVAAEMMEYEISGFHFDMLDFGFFEPYGCWCSTCQAAFRQTYGMTMPAGVTWDDAWEKMLEFRCESNTRFCRELQAFVKSRRPDISVDFNYHGYPPFSWAVGQRPVLHAMNGDFVTAEGLPWKFGHTNPSLLAMFMAGARPKGSIQGVTSRSVFDYHDFTVRPVAEMKWEVMTYLAHGAQCTIVDKAFYDGSIDPVAYDRMGEVFGEALAKREYFGHRPLADVGLYYSCRSRDWYGREDVARYMAAFWGAHKALVHSHIPMGVIMDENASAERLAEFPVVYLANCAVLTDREIDLFDRYVSGGGKLLVTGLTGVCDRHGQMRKEWSLSKIAGARLVGCQIQHPDNYIRLPGSPDKGELGMLGRDIRGDWPILTWGPRAVLESTGARTFGELLVAHRPPANPWAGHMSPNKVVGPAVLIHSHGNGKVVTVPCAVDAAYVRDYRMPEHRLLIRNLIRYLHPEPLVAVEAPLNVEIVVTRDEARKRLLIHLLCFSGPATGAAVAFPNGDHVLPPLMEEAMRYSVRIRVTLPFAKMGVAGPQSQATLKDGVIHLESAQPHEVVTIAL